MTAWDAIFAARPWGRWPAEAVVREVARFAARRGAPLDVLEVGCAAGAQLWYLQHDGHRATGLDLSIEGLRQATTRLRAEHQPVRLVQADARHLPIRDASVDVVLDVETFAHVPEAYAQDLWNEAARVLRPGGRLVSIGFTEGTAGTSTGDRAGRTVSDLSAGPLAGIPLVTLIDEASAGLLAQHAGLEIIDVQGQRRTTGPDRDPIDELIVVAERR